MQTIEQLEAALTALNAQRAILGDAIVDLAIAPLQQRLEALRQPPPGLTGERKLVTIMFADISGFTAMSESLDPEQVRVLMNACFDALLLPIKRYEGTIDKYIGDAVMALFGAPYAYENHAERSVRAALEMFAALAIFNQARGTHLGLHIGINTGLVVAGGMGAQGQQQYSVMGDAVNLAARLEDASERGEILVGSTTQRLTASLFDYETRAPLILKGKREPVANYLVQGTKAKPAPARGIAGLRSPLIGREAEQALLAAHLDRLRRGEGGGQVALIGEAGIGKSRLIAEMRAQADDQLSFVEGRAFSFTERMSFWLMRDLLHNIIGTRDGDPVETVSRALRANMGMLPSAALAPFLARMLELPLDGVEELRIKDLTSEALRARVMASLVEFIRLHAMQKPMVIVCEDLHWADPSSFALLDLLLKLPCDTPLLMILAARPDSGPVQTLLGSARLPPGDRLHVMNLQPLTEAHSRILLGHLLQLDTLPEKFQQIILDKSEGNAFFLEEVLRGLIDAGMLLIEDERAVAVEGIHALRTVDVPDTLQEVIAARIDRLTQVQKATLQTAAVIGRVFQPRILLHLFHSKRLANHPDEPLLELDRRALIRPRGELEFIFKHALTQEVAYQSLLLEQRKTLHGVIAEAIEVLFQENLAELAPTLAYHYELANSPEKAIHYLMTAAERARASYANLEAAAYFQAALRQIDQVEATPGGTDETSQNARHETALRAHQGAGDAFLLVARRDEARAAYHAGLARLKDHNHIQRSHLCRSIAGCYNQERQADKAERYLKDAVDALGDFPPAPGVDWVYEYIELGLDRLWHLYWCFYPVEPMEALAQHLEPVVSLHGTARQRSRFHRSIVLIGLYKARWHQPAYEYVERSKAAIVAARESGELVEIGFALFQLAFVHLWRDELEQAEQVFLQAIPLAERCGDKERLVLGNTYQAFTHRLRGKIDATRKLARHALALAADAGMPVYVSLANGNLAWVALREGDLDSAAALARKAIERLPPKFPITNTYWISAAVNFQQGDDAGVIQAFREILDPARQSYSPALTEGMQAAIDAWDSARLNEARAASQSALSLSRQLNYT